MINKILTLFLFLHFSLFVISCSSDDSQVNKDAIGMENLIGLEFTQSERDTLLPGLKVLKSQYDTLRTVALDNSVPVPLYFDPMLELGDTDIHPVMSMQAALDALKQD